MLSASDALERMLSAVRPLTDIETISTLEAYGRVLASGLVSHLDVPPMDNSAMDGYAVHAADCVDGAAALPVTQRIPAGYAGEALAPGTAARIFTGAMIPPGADAVVMQERCELIAGSDADGGRVIVSHVPVPGENIRRRGEDIRAGSAVLSAGRRLGAQDLGLAASVGLADIPVHRRLRVAVFFTGDELVMPGEPLKPGAIYNSNRFVLRGLLEALGCVVADLGNVPDSLAATRDALRDAARGNDCVITCGGVSVGEEDHVKAAVEAEGALNLWQIAIKPGKPLAFGTLRAGHGDDASMQSIFIGLPGNPVSSFVTFLLFALPVLKRMQGVADVTIRAIPMRADFDWTRADKKRQEYLRARVNESGGLDLFSNQGSAVLTSVSWADGLVENPPGQTIARGDTVRFLPFASLLS